MQARSSATQLNGKGKEKLPASAAEGSVKAAVWLEINSDEDDEDDGACSGKESRSTSRQRSTTTRSDSKESLTQPKKRKRQSSTRESLGPPPPRAPFRSLATNSALNKTDKSRASSRGSSSSGAREGLSKGTGKKRSPKGVSPELGLFAVKEETGRNGVAEEDVEMEEEEDSLPSRVEFTHSFYLDFEVGPRRAQKTQARRRRGPPGRPASLAVTVEDSEDSGSEDVEAEAVVAGSSTSTRSSSIRPSPAKKRLVHVPRLPPSPSVSPDPIAVLPVTSTCRPSPLPPPPPKPAPLPGQLVDRPPPFPPALPSRAHNPDYEPAVLCGGFIRGTFAFPSPRLSSTSPLLGRGRGGRARSSDEAVVGINGGRSAPPSSTSSVGAYRFALPCRPGDAETSSGRTSIEPSPVPALILEPPTPKTAAPVASTSAANANAPRRTSRIPIQAALPSAVAASLAVRPISSSHYLQPSEGAVVAPPNLKAQSRRRWAFLKERRFGDGMNSDPLDCEWTGWGKEDGARNVRGTRGEERWVNVKGRAWWRAEREAEADAEGQSQSAEGEAQSHGGEGEGQEKGWKFSTEVEVRPWEFDGLDYGRGRAWNAGEGMDPGEEVYGRRWAVSDPYHEYHVGRDADTTSDASTEDSSEEGGGEEGRVGSSRASAAELLVVEETDSDDCIIIDAPPRPSAHHAQPVSAALALAPPPHAFAQFPLQPHPPLHFQPDPYHHSQLHPTLQPPLPSSHLPHPHFGHPLPPGYYAPPPAAFTYAYAVPPFPYYPPPHTAYGYPPQFYQPPPQHFASYSAPRHQQHPHQQQHPRRDDRYAPSSDEHRFQELGDVPSQEQYASSGGGSAQASTSAAAAAEGLASGMGMFRVDSMGWGRGPEARARGAGGAGARTAQAAPPATSAEVILSSKSSATPSTSAVAAAPAAIVDSDDNSTDSEEAVEARLLSLRGDGSGPAGGAPSDGVDVSGYGGVVEEAAGNDKGKGKERWSEVVVLSDSD